MKSKFVKQSAAFILTITLTVMSALAQTQEKKNQKPLSEKENPLLVGKRDINKGSMNFYSLEKEVALGRQLAAEQDRASEFVTDPIVTEYVNRVAQNIVLHSDARIPFTIKVLDANDVNAFALPGGFLYVNRGLIEAADNEAELAGVLAHEIAHVTARHGVEQASKGTFLNYASIPLIFLGGWGGYIVQQVAGLAVPLTFLKFSRGAEKEADRLGAQYMWAAGYDPHAMVTFFEKLQAKNKKKPGFISKAFSTHPLTEDRIKEVQKLLVRFPEKTEYQISTSEFVQVRNRLVSLRAASRPLGRTDNSDNGRPTLKRRPQSDNGTAGDTEQSAPERPTLKRRPDSNESDSSATTKNPQGEEPESVPARPTLKRRPDSGN